MLTWQLTARWQYDPASSTEIEVGFFAEGPRRTRVELEHRQLERYGADAEAMKKALESDSAWVASLQAFAGAAARGKFLTIYETTPEGLARARDHLPAHRDRLDQFHARGTLLMAGPVMDGSGRAFGVFTSRQAAEDFIAAIRSSSTRSSRAGRSPSGTRFCSDRRAPAHARTMRDSLVTLQAAAAFHFGPLVRPFCAKVICGGSSRCSTTPQPGRRRRGGPPRRSLPPGCR